jgi:hypothetical protein
MEKMSQIHNILEAVLQNALKGIVFEAVLKMTQKIDH